MNDLVTKKRQDDFKVISSSKTYSIRKIKVVDSLSIIFNKFAIVWFIRGAKLVPNKEVDIQLLLRLTEMLLAPTIEKVGLEEMLPMEFDGKEMNTLLLWLSARINHCEIQRQEESEEFQIETMIAMKMLRLDMRESLFLEQE